MKIGLLLVGHKGVSVLKKIKDPSNIKFVLAYNDINTKDDSYDKIIELCGLYNIPFYSGKKIDETYLRMVDKIFVIGWQYLLDIDFDKLVVFHDSILPEYKGWAPTVNYLIEGRGYIGATAFKPTEIADTGMVYAQKKEYIKYPIKIEDALNKISNIYSELINFIIQNSPEPSCMDGDESFCLWRDNLDYFIDWSCTADRIKRFVDAVGYPYDGAKIKLGDKVLRVIDSEVIKGTVVNVNKHLGKVLRLDGGVPIVVCSENLVKLTTVIDESGNPYVFTNLKNRL
tara:strand:- start:958 stop:1812 length:855 start_codon:yes stop_codon:yes gene_type:complete